MQAKQHERRYIITLCNVYHNVWGGWWSIETSVAVSPTGVGVESGPTLGQTGGAGWLLGGVDFTQWG